MRAALRTHRDCVGAFYGVPISFGNDAANALKTAVQMQRAFQALKAEWEQGPGLSWASLSG